MHDRLVYRITYAFAHRGLDDLLRRFVRVLIEGDVDPQAYYKKHGRCPAGYHYDGEQCQPVDDAEQKEAKQQQKAKERKQRQKAETQKAVTSLADAIAAGKLRGTVREHFTTARKLQSQHVAKLDASLKELQEIAAPGMKVKGRVKTIGSAVGKLVRKPKYGTADKLQDMTGMRLIGDTIDQVMTTVNAIKKKYEVIAEDDYISSPQGDYRSYHLIIVQDGLAKEVQVRTKNQDVFADWAHNVYKPITPEQEKSITDAAAKKTIDSYSKQASEYMFARDQGKKVVEPPSCPDVVRQAFGCLPI